MAITDAQRLRLARRPTLSPAETERIDTRLALLGRGTGAMRLRIGEGLLRLDALGGVKALGFPNIESYCREALGRTGRWGSDVRALARRLATLPRLRHALVTGDLNPSMVELVARVATPLDEAEWVARAQTMNVRAMRAELTRRRIDTIDDTAPERVTLMTTVDRLDAWAFERAKLMVGAAGATGEDAIEAMLAEGMTEILAQIPDFDLPSPLTPGGIDELRSERAEYRALRDASEAAVEAITPITPPTFDPDPEIDWPTDLTAIDQLLRKTSQDLAWRDLELAVLGRRAEEYAIWFRYGFCSWDQYCRDWIGVAPSVMASRLALAKRMTGLTEIAAAMADGRIGFEAASTISRVATRSTVAAWVDRATVRTVKHLKEEVAAVELLARVEGRPAESCTPPDEATLEAVRDLERSVLAPTSDCEDDGRMSGGSVEPDAANSAGDSTDLPTTTVRLSLSEDLGRFWRTLESVHAALSNRSESFIAFLCRATAKTWSGAFDTSVAYADIYHRDRWRCASPVCNRRNVTPHHVKFRSHGGSDHADNVIALCEVCHLELVHGNRLRVTGKAPTALRWEARGWAA